MSLELPLRLAMTSSKSAPDCAHCPWADPETKLPRHEPVMGVFPANPIGVLVGEGPGAEEVEKKEPFVGRTGQWLDDRLSENDLNRGKLVVINAQGCQPPKGLKTDDTMRAATKACHPLFMAQYEKYKTLPVLAMGKWASSAVNNLKPITIETGRGFIRDNLLATWHPTYAAFYNPWKAGEFVNDLQRFKRMLEGKLEPAPTVIRRGTVQDFISLASSPWARQVGLSVDLETRAGAGRPAHEGKDPYRAVIKTIALGIPDLGIGYWWGSDTKVQNVIIRILQDPKLAKVWHNGWMFDQPICIRHGVHPVNCRDTRDMRRAVSATSRLSLRFLTSVHTDFAPWKETEDDK